MVCHHIGIKHRYTTFFNFNLIAGLLLRAYKYTRIQIFHLKNFYYYYGQTKKNLIYSMHKIDAKSGNKLSFSLYERIWEVNCKQTTTIK